MLTGLSGGSPPAAAQGAGAKVTIQGGPDETRQQYNWTVTNFHSSPIVAIEFPSHNADQMSAPPDWSVDTRAAHVSVATANSPAAGVVSSGKFGVRVSRLGAMAGRGSVLVRFADGSSYSVAGVAVPRGQSIGERAITPIGLGLILVILIGIARRNRKRAAAAAASEPRP